MSNEPELTPPSALERLATRAARVSACFA